MRPDSDIDLLIVSDEEHDELEEHLAGLQAETTAWVGNDTRILHVTSAQVTRDEPALVAAADEGIIVAGNAMWLRRTLRKQVGHGA
jgi:predicted nucleotidyltransferase